jgi:hypothetical protein
MPEARTFQDVATLFDERVRRIVWCTVSTVDTQGRPFSRILHPIWEGDRQRAPDARDEAPGEEPDAGLVYWIPLTTP